jgi:hypothetical protein
MEQLPKIVRERLQATAKPGAHPDPDLLTAFAEKSLSERERGPVLEHLSTCAECREVVSLSLPQMKLEQVAAAAAAPRPAPVRSRWLRGPVLGWGALAACAVVVGSVMLGYHSHEKKAQFIAAKEEAPAMLAAQSRAKREATIPKDELAAKIEPSSPPKSPSRARADMGSFSGAAKAIAPAKQLTKKKAEPAPLVANQVAADQVAAKTAARPGAAFGAAAAAPSIVAESANQAVVASERDTAQSVAVQAAAPKETVEVAASGIQATTARLESKPATNAAAPAPPPPVVTLDKTMALAQPSGAFQGSAKSNEVVLRTAANPVTPRWTVSSDGTTLMRSLDDGKTWQVIPVTGNMVFRAVASVGPQVWVGGAGGALYHSSDAGSHWKQLNPNTNGAALKADIVSLEFTDALHGKLGTAEGETWTTSDGGLTWQKK